MIIGDTNDLCTFNYVDISVVEDVDKLLILGWGWHGSVCPNY